MPAGIELIVCVGNLKPVKGHDVLIKAFAQLARIPGRDWFVLAVGAIDSWKRKLDCIGADTWISHDRVEFIGPRQPDEVVTWLQAADVFALASHREGCCNAVLEALATGTPVVATRVGDNEDSVVQRENGFSSAARRRERSSTIWFWL